MKIQVVILFFTVLAFAQDENAGKRCFENMTLGTSEITLINRIKEQILNKETFDASCLHILIHRGFYKASIILFEDYFLTNNIDLHESTLRLIQSQKRDLDKFISTTMSAKQSVQQIEPFIKWAQSQNNIFLHIKLSMRADSPACVHCKIEKVELTNSTFFMSSYGIQSHQPLRFLLNLTLFDEIDPETSTWNEDSVGSLFFNLTKVHKVILPTTTYEESQEQINTNSTETAEQPSDSNKQGNSTNQQQENTENTNSTNSGEKEEQQQTDSTNTTTHEEDKQKENPQQDESAQQDQGKVSNEKVEQPTQTSTNTNTQKENISNKIWLRLEKLERKKDTSIWWDMRDRYQNDMDEWDKLCAQERENKKKKKQQQSKHSASSNPNQQTKAAQQEQQQQSQSSQHEQQQPQSTTESQDGQTKHKIEL